MRFREMWAKALMLLVMALSFGCGAVKERKVIMAPAAYAQAKTATPSELLELINFRYANIESLTVSKFEVEFTGGSIDEGYLEKYRKGKGYLIAQEPDSIFVNILNPLTSSSVLVMASRNEQFQLWIPSKNQFVMGRTDIKAEEANPVYNVRPSHLVEGILVEPIPIDNPLFRYYVEEEEDVQFRYYVLGVIRLKNDSPVAELLRKIWIERSTLQLKRQRYYEGSEVISSIRYADAVDLEQKRVSTQIEIRRPRERYSINLRLDPESIGIDREVRPDAFSVLQPPGAEMILVGSDQSK